MNNPIKLVDLDGKDPIKVDPASPNVTSLLIRTAMRPSGRSILTLLVSQSGQFNMKEGQLPAGTTANTQGIIPKDESTGQQKGKVTLNMTFDTQEIKKIHPDDPSGLASMGHELYHGRSNVVFSQDILNKAYNIEKEDHWPNNPQGAAAEFGRLLSNEHPDMTWEAAEQWLYPNALGLAPPDPPQQQ